MKKFLLSCFLLLFTYSYAVVAGDNQTTWNTGAYEDNANLSKKLYITGASKLKVKIKGSTEEGYDFVYVYDQNGKLVRKLSGNIDEEFIVDGSLITAKLISDDATEDKGVIVSIQKADGSSSNYTSWKVNNYDNNENIEKRLHIDGASKIKVKLSGKTEAGYDYLTIKDLNGNIIKELSGSFDETFVVDGSDIIAHFESDDATTDKGFSVDISNSDGTLPDVTTWVTGAYDNDDILTKDLRISKADRLKVKIQGSTEKDYDFVYIYDQNGELVKKLSGNIDQEFIVDGSLITAKLISDDSVTDSGVRVEIKKVSINPNPSNLPSVGSIANAKVKIYQINSDGSKKLLWSETTSSGDTLKEIGKFNAHINDLKDDEIYLYVAKGGEDWDINRDGIKDSKATKNIGIFRAAAKGSDVKDAGSRFNITSISEILFELSSKDYAKEKFYHSLNKNVSKILKQGTLIDILTFNPLYNMNMLSIKYKQEYSDIIKLINRGRIPLLNTYNKLKTSGISKDLAILKSKNIVLLASWNNALLSIDVSDYFNPKIISSVDTMCNSVVVTKDETKAFVADEYDGLVYVDITNPSNIVRESIFKKAAGAKRVILSSDETKAFIVAGKNGFIIVDIRDPYNMKVLGKYTDLTDANDLAISKDESKAFIADSKGGLKILNINTPNNIKLISKIGLKKIVRKGKSYDNANIRHIAISKDKSYVFLNIVGDKGLVIVDISNINKPKVIYGHDREHFYTYPYHLGKIYVSGDDKKVYFTNDRNLYIYDISNIKNPIIVNSYRTSSFLDTINAVAISDDKPIIYLATKHGLSIVNNIDGYSFITENSSIKLGGGVYSGLRLLNNNKVGFTDVGGQAFIINVKKPTKPSILAIVNADLGYNNAISKDAKRVYTDLGIDGFDIYDISKGKEGVKLGYYSLEFASDRVKLSEDDTKAFVTDFKQGLVILDVSEPKNIHKISSYLNEKHEYDDIDQIILSKDNKIGYFTGLGMYNSKFKGYIDIVDLSNLASPKRISTYSVDDYISAMVISKDDKKLYVIFDDNLMILDVSNPAHVKKLYSGAEFGNFGAHNIMKYINISKKGDILFAQSSKGLTFINVKDPKHPFLIGSYNLGSPVGGIVLSEDNKKAYILHSEGFNIIDLGIFEY